MWDKLLANLIFSTPSVKRESTQWLPRGWVLIVLVIWLKGSQMGACPEVGWTGPTSTWYDIAIMVPNYMLHIQELYKML